MRQLLLVVSCGLLLLGCTIETPGLTVLATEADAALVRDGLGFLQDDRVHLTVVADVDAELKRRAGVVVALTAGTSCSECYRLEGSGTLLRVKGGGPLGVQYGLWHALEALGYRFPHPRYTKKPDTFQPVSDEVLNRDFAPEVQKRRGLHFHTLHPIEQLWDFWVAGPDTIDGGKRAIDFIIKHRGNYVQWCALDDIVKSPSLVPAWQDATRTLVDYAHAHGVKAGIALQLFGESNLQNAFDLIDDTSGDPVPEMERRLHLLLDGNHFDALNLSFGEFFGAEPAVFVQNVNTAYAAMQRVQPGVEVMATIHVGNYDNLRVEFMGQQQLYYFLVRYADPAIVPWVHTTMYYNLYEPTGGAYLHTFFDEHRAYLEDRLRAQQPVGYFPESAYWVAFDINIPTFMPLYVRSRHLDLERLAQAGALQDHVLFSSGWEWGYWLTDATTLRMTYQRPATWDAALTEFYAGWGGVGAKAADLVKRLGEAQHRALIIEKLAAYVASRDQLIDAGDKLGIFSQPDRPEFDELIKATPAARAQFRAEVLTPLKGHAAELATLTAEADAALTGDDPVLVELRDGFSVTAHRVQFIAALYEAALEHAEGRDATALLQAADTAWNAAKEDVARRRRALWEPDVKSVLRNNTNPTFYQYGYLREGDTLCFWERERAQARNGILGSGLAVPGCVL